jgi:hypothetical protein
MKKILKKIVFILLICIVSFFVFVKYWAGPQYIRQRFGKAVSTFWDGQLRFEGAQFNFFGDQHYKGVSFIDNKGRKWAYADTINATLGNWPSRNYYLRNVDIDKLTVEFLLDTDKKTFPLKPAFSGSAPKDPTAVLQSVNINTGSVSVIAINGEKIYLGDMFLLAKRREGKFEFSSSVNKSGEQNDLLVKGIVNTSNSEVDISVKIDRVIGKNEAALLISVLDLKKNIEASGKLLAVLSIRGKINEPSNISVNGDANLEKWNLYVDSAEPLVTDINAVIGVADHHLDLEKFSVDFCDGIVEAAVHIDNYRSKEMEITGHLRVDTIDLGELASKLGSEKIKTGKATLDYSFNASNMRLEALLGQGVLTIDNADLLPVPLLTNISKAVGLTDKEMQATSDATAAFNSKGLELEIEQAYFTNQHEAIVIEPGGIIDLKNRSVDMYVTAFQLRQMGDFIRKIPVIRLFARLKDKLTRLRIKGQWSEPADKLIKKEPVKDVKEGVVNFFTDVADSSGQLTEAIIKSTQDVFERKESE